MLLKRRDDIDSKVSRMIQKTYAKELEGYQRLSKIPFSGNGTVGTKEGSRLNSRTNECKIKQHDIRSGKSEWEV